MRYKMGLSFVGLFLLSALFGPGVGPVRAADIRSGDTVIIAADEVIDDDLIVSGTIIEINGTVTGDLVAAGQRIVVRGTVENSAMLAAQTIEVLGRVDGSLYAGGYSMTLGEAAVVGRNAFFAGYNLTTSPGSQIEGDLYVTGAQVMHDGAVGGDLNVGVNALEINGRVAGDVTGSVGPTGATAQPPFAFPGMPQVEPLPSGLLIGPAAQIGGQVSAQEAAVEAPAGSERGFLGLPRWVIDRIGETIGLLIIAALLIYLAPRMLPAVSDVLRRKPLPSLGWGVLIYLLLFPLALIVGLVLIFLLTLIFGLLTFGQYTLAVLGLSGGFFVFALIAFLFITYIIAWLIVGHTLGRAILSRAGMDSSNRMTQFLYVALGVVLFQVLRAVPVLGFVVAFLVGALALGALFSWWLERRRLGKAVEPLPLTVTGDSA